MTHSVNRWGPPSMSRAELGIQGLNRWAVNCLEMSGKRGVQAARNGPSLPPTPAGGPVAKAEIRNYPRTFPIPGFSKRSEAGEGVFG